MNEYYQNINGEKRCFLAEELVMKKAEGNWEGEVNRGAAQAQPLRAAPPGPGPGPERTWSPCPESLLACSFPYRILLPVVMQPGTWRLFAGISSWPAEPPTPAVQLRELTSLTPLRVTPTCPLCQPGTLSPDRTTDRPQ